MNNFDQICLSGGYHLKMISAQHWYTHGIEFGIELV
jgi:hypothetical protein